MMTEYDASEWVLEITPQGEDEPTVVIGDADI